MARRSGKRRRVGRPRLDGDGDAAARAMGMLGNGTRLKILLALAGGEFNVNELCGLLGGTQAGSHHLGLLKTAGWVTPRQEGTRIYYRLTEDAPPPGTIRVTLDGAIVEVSPA